MWITRKTAKQNSQNNLEERMNFERQRAEQERYDRQRQTEVEQRERDRQRAFR